MTNPPTPRRGLSRLPVGATIAAIATALLLASCTSTGSGSPADPQPTSSAADSAATSDPAVSDPASTPTTSGPPPKVVHVSSLEADGATYGIGMPIILSFSPTPTDSTEFTKAVTVAVNGHPVKGAWFWEKPFADQPVQAHFRMRNYWPAHATIEVKLPIGGLSAGKGLAYSGALTSVTFNTGDAHVSRVDGTIGALRMTVTSNGKVVRTVPVSLGAAQTPTYNGIKVVMQKGENLPGSEKLRPRGAVHMKGPGYDELVDWSVRITAGGEYVHAAPWNSRIGQVSTSNGCTNLSTADAKWFYSFAQVGDVVTYSGSTGHRMPSWDGYGDWNVPWPRWTQGGLLINH